MRCDRCNGQPLLHLIQRKPKDKRLCTKCALMNGTSNTIAKLHVFIKEEELVLVLQQALEIIATWSVTAMEKHGSIYD